MSNPIITLLTDFGLADHYVAAMKGVILGICPNAHLIDISHQVQPYAVSQAAFLLTQAHAYFPKKTVHVAVVDPGVGSTRRPILVEAAGQYFVAPDNGLLSLISTTKVRHITTERYFLPNRSSTFHGRDIFAPVAAHLAAGVPAAKFGKAITDFVQLSLNQPTQTGRRIWTGSVLHIDQFGNLITDFKDSEFSQVKTRTFELLIGLQTIQRWRSSYSEAEPGELFLITGSSGYLEVSAKQQSAAKLLGCGVGAPAELTLY